MGNKINGNTDGIRDSMLARIEAIYDMAQGADTFAGCELVETIAACSYAINREISVYIRRNGTIADVSIGDSATVSMPEMRVVRNESRLCGVRCIHTHPGGGAMLSPVDIGTLKSMKLDSMAAIAIQDGKPTALYAGFLGEWDDAEGFGLTLYGPLKADRLPQQALMRELYAADNRLKSSTASVEGKPERAILVGLVQNNGFDSMGELALLAQSAGAQVVGQNVQRRNTIDNASYIGSGKVDELRLQGSALEADIYIFDDELSAIQLRNLEEALSRPVIDRTMLILDIFAARAQSREGRLQVELAQLRYRLPRLMGAGLVLSRQGAGIGTRGPGEKKLEIDRRRIRSRIHDLEEELKEVTAQRAVRRERREKNAIPLVTLVGYTNAGKSTLLNALSGSDVLAEDMLFATLDPVVRQVTLPEGTAALFSDTVGFINKLPHDLVRAFQSTLEEVTKSDLILHVVDCANPHYDMQMQVVDDVLARLGAADTPRINVYNQIDKDLANPGKRKEYVWISAKTGTGLPVLLQAVERMLNKSQVRIELTIPFDRYDALSLIHASGRVLQETHEADGTHITALLDEGALWKVNEAMKAR